MKLAKEFVKFVVKELGLKSLPKNIKFEGDDYSTQHLTFGTYDPSTDEIVVVKGTRHPIDVLRTLAHELVHHKQRQDNKQLDGTDGSHIENEANAHAGTLMRKFRTTYPEIFTKQNVNVNEKIDKIISITKTGVPQKIDEQYVDGFTAKLLVTVLHKLTPENKVKLCNESINTMVAIAYKITAR